MSGLDILKTVKEKFPDTVCCMISGHNDIEAVFQAGKAGAVKFFTKPLDYDKLFAVVDRVQASLGTR